MTLTDADKLLHLLYCQAACHPRPPRYRLTGPQHAQARRQLLADELIEPVPGGVRLTPAGIRRGSELDRAHPDTVTA